MNFDRTGSRLALVANLGVVGGLVLLAYELNQLLLRFQGMRTAVTGNQASEPVPGAEEQK